MTERLLRPSVLAGAAVLLVAGFLLFRAPWAVGLSGSAAPAASTFAVDCEPHQQALVRQAAVTGPAQFTVACVSRPVAPRVVRTSTTAARQTPAASSTRASQPARSWKKTALVIGGSTGAGAGIGAAVGGKKGALIGAAIGGGASALFEAIKR
jgi:hypothetical protein